MKKITFFVAMFLIFSSHQIMAQVPQGINYQAVARDNNGIILKNAALMVRFSIIDQSAAVHYQETHSLSTDNFGHINAIIGSGTVVSGSFNSINWLSGSRILKTELDPDGNGYISMGSNKFMSVPYAFASGSAANADSSFWNPASAGIFYDMGTVGIGLSNPTSSAKLHVDNGKALIGAAGGLLPARLVVNAGVNEEIFRGRENGTSRFVIEHNGYVGIGTVSPSGPIEVKSGTTSRFLVNDNGRVGIGTSSPGGIFQVNVGGNPKFFISSSTGNVGLGTSSPGTIFDVAYNSSLTSQGIRINNTGSGDAILRFASVGSTRYSIGIDQSDNNYLKIASGIGVSSGVIMTFKSDDVVFADDITADAVIADRIDVNAGGRVDIGSIFLVDGGSQVLFADCTIRPFSTNDKSLGTSGFRYKNIYLNNSPNVSSDRRLKKDIKKLNYGLKEVMQLRPVTYKWKNGTDKQDKIGLIAQEVEEVIEEVIVSGEFVINDKSGEKEWQESEYLGVTYSELIPVLIKAIQEQQQIINGLESRIAGIEKNTVTPASKSTLAGSASTTSVLKEK